MPIERSRRAVRRVLFARGSWAETSRVTTILRKETTGGVILLIAATVALVWANSPFADSYNRLRDVHVGRDIVGLHLDLSLHAWAADGLLAIFFFVVGLELKREFVSGDLRDPRRAALPIAAAVGGMIVPALIFVAFTASAAEGAVRGWAVPTATDIAFAVAVLAVISTHLPAALRTFLLTLAIVDDLLAILVIALVYTDRINLAALGLAVIPLALFTMCVQRRVQSLWVLLPLALLTWVLVHESGVHATVAGVLLGFAVPVAARGATGESRDGQGPAERFEHLIRPVSAGIAVPVFAFFAAGVDLGGYQGFLEALRDPIATGIVVGLVVGKTAGVFGTTRILAAVSRASLDPALRWIDVFGIAILAGIGFTVSLLIGELAYGYDSPSEQHVKVGVLTGSLVAACLASIVLRLRNRHYRAVELEETRDDDLDGTPDVFQARR